MINVLEKTTRLRYNSFLEPNRRREAAEAFENFIRSFAPLSEIKLHMCKDDIQCIVEMLVEERRNNMRRIANPYFITEEIENAEIV